MQDRPDLIESELSGLAFDSLQQCFRPGDIEAMFAQEALIPPLNDDIYLIVDPAAGGPGSDYALLSMQRHRGNVTIVGIDILSGCKEPSKQFALIEEHIAALRKNLYRTNSKVTIFVERNLVSCFKHTCTFTYIALFYPCYQSHSFTLFLLLYIHKECAVSMLQLTFLSLILRVLKASTIVMLYLICTTYLSTKTQKQAVLGC
jgi:hypothetical protein